MGKKNISAVKKMILNRMTKLDFDLNDLLQLKKSFIGFIKWYLGFFFVLMIDYTFFII